MATYNASYSTELLTLTFDKRAKTVEDNVFNSTAFLDWLRKNAKTEDGGTYVGYPVEYGLNDTVSSYTDYDSFDITPQNTATMAQYRWGAWGGSVIISDMEEDKNAGASQVVKLLQHKEDSLTGSISEYMADKFINSDGTGNSNKDPYGLAHLIATDTTTSTFGTVGGIDSSGGNATWWRPRYRWGSDGSGADEVLTKANVDSVYLQCARGTGGAPDLELTTEDLYLKFESLLFTNIRYEDVKTANGGFDSIRHKGANIIHDYYCPAKCWYLLNSKSLFLVKHASHFMRMGKFVEFPDKEAKVALHSSTGQLVTTARRKQGILASQTAS